MAGFLFYPVDGFAGEGADVSAQKIFDFRDELQNYMERKAADARRRPAFEPYKGKYRKPGTGCVTQIGDHLWEGKYSPKWPDGKRHSRSVYAGTESECEAKLAGLIRQMKAEIAAAKELTAQGRIDKAMALANEKKPRGARRAESRL